MRFGIRWGFGGRDANARKDAMEDETDRQLMDIAIREATRLDNIITEPFQYAAPALNWPSAHIQQRRLPDADLVQRRTRTRRRSQCVTSLATGALTAMVDQVGCRQVFWNMATNAFEAMPEGGQLTVSTSRRHVDLRDRKNVDVIEIAFQDTGRVFRSRTSTRLFPVHDKEAGSGLGLAAVHRIVDLHGGWIEWQSQERQGCHGLLYVCRV